ncbi:unnamed protein product [Bathycoccus prasinos]
MFSYRRVTDDKKEIDKDLSIQVYSAPELSTKSWVVKETQIPLYTSIKNQVDDGEHGEPIVAADVYVGDEEKEEKEEEEEAINKNVKPPTSVPSWFSRSIAKQEDKTAKLSKSKLEINNLWEEKQEAEKIWIEAIEKEEAEQRTTNPIRSGSDSYGIPYYNKGGANGDNTAVNKRSRNKWSNGDNTAVNKESFTYCDAVAIVGKVVKSSS